MFRALSLAHIVFMGWIILTQQTCYSAPLKIDINQGQIAPTPIALAPFTGHAAEAGSNVGRQIVDVIASDLERSGLFRPIDPQAFIQDSESLCQGPRFADWRVINAQVLGKGKLAVQPDGRLRIEFYLYDVITETEMEATAYVGDMHSWRRIAHKIADAIYKRITGEEGYFDSQIVYVAETGPMKRRTKRLALMDQDSAGHRYLTSGQTLVLTPRFSPNVEQVTYLDFASGKAKAYIMNLKNDNRKLLSDFPGMTIAPRYSPNGKRVVVSASAHGSTNLYLVDLATRGSLRLTQNPYIDTSPSFAPDGRKICFNSDRSGKTHLYTMNVSGGDAVRISYGEGSYRTPVWSPRGDLIAFTKIARGEFYIGVMRPDGSGERLLAQGWIVEDPSWAPNGRVIMFTRRQPRGISRIFTIDLTGYNERVVPTPTDASAATWSPLIP